MSDPVLVRRFPRGQADHYSFLSSTNDAAPVDEPQDAAELFAEGATAYSRSPHHGSLQEIDPLLFSDLETPKDSGQDAESPYDELERGKQVMRLIRVLPRSTPGTISCRSTTHSLVEAPAYTALSYTWGRPGTDCSIEMNGVTVAVRKNLWRFLQQVQQRAADRNKLFWIDALCIDQHNLSERTHQVGLMSKIYSSADQVMVWLGPAYGDSDLALQTLSKWAATENIADAEVAKIWWKPHGAALRRVCERSYWSRLWILQELVLAKDVLLLCGSRRAPGSTLSRFLLRARTLPPTTHRDENLEYQPAMKSRAMSILREVQRSRRETCLLDQMRISQHLRCHEPRDKVYALLGIVDRGHEGILPDYTIGLPSLLNAVLRNHHKYRSAKDLLNVKRQCQELCEAVGVPITTIFILKDQDDNRAPPPEDAMHTRLIDPESGLTLWWARLYGHRGVADMLASKLDQRLLNDHLVRSAREGNLDVIQFWLSTGLSILGCRDDRGRNLVGVSTPHGHAGVVKVLLEESDIEVNSQDYEGKAAIHVAASFGLTEVLKILLAHTKTNVNIFDQDLCTPLHLAIRQNRTYSIQLLMGRPDLDMNLASCQSQTPFERRLSADTMKITPLEFALSREQADVIEMLLERSDVEVTPSNWTFKWHSPLHQSIRMKKDHILRLLLERQGVDVNFLSAGGHRPLHVALSQGTASAITMLTSHRDIDFTLPDSDGDTPLHLAVRHKHDLAVIELLRMYCFLGIFPASLRLLSERAMLEYDSRSATGVASVEDDFSAPDRLERNHFDPSAWQWRDSISSYSMKSASDLTAKHKVDLNVKNENEAAPLHEAITAGRNNAASLLLSMPGIDVSLQNRAGETPLYMAATLGNETIVRLLLLHKNIDVTIRSIYGLSAIEVARREGHTGVVELLRRFAESDGSGTAENSPTLLDLAWSSWKNDDPIKSSNDEPVSVKGPGFVVTDEHAGERAEAAAILKYFREGHFGVKNNFFPE